MDVAKMKIYTIDVGTQDVGSTTVHFLHPDNPSAVQFELDATHATEFLERDVIIQEMLIAGYIHVPNVVFSDEQGETWEEPGTQL